MERSTLIALLATENALPIDTNEQLTYTSMSEPHYRRAVDLLAGLGLLDGPPADFDTHRDPNTGASWETFTVAGVSFDGPIDVLAAGEAIAAQQPQPDAAPIEKLATIDVVVDGVPARIQGAVAEQIADAVRQATSSRAVASLREARDSNVVAIDRARQEPAGDAS